MVRKISICFVLATNSFVGDLGVLVAQPYPPPQQPPRPLSARPAAAGLMDAQEAVNNDANRKLLEQKLAERDRLQREIESLRRAAGMPQQILVKLRAIEINRSKLRRLGIDWETANGKQVSVKSAADVLDPSGAHRGEAFEFAVVAPGDAFHGFLRALEANNTAKVLAEPSILTLSGRPASFLVGGEVPLPASPESKDNVQFQKFGTQVDIVATSLGDNHVRMDLRVRLSEPDYARTITIEDQSVPTFNIRQIDTAIELPFGQSAAFTGLIQRRDSVIITREGQQKAEVEEVETLFIATPQVVEASENVTLPEFAKAYDAPSSVK